MIKLENPKRPQSVDDLIDPKLIAGLGRLDFASKKIFAGKLKGERRSKKRGESVEFADHRPYVVGDDMRHIDWNIYARLDRLFLKLFLEEEDLSLHIVIDATASADCGEPAKFLYMQRVAMTLGYVGLVNLNRVAITSLGGRIETSSPAPGGGGAEQSEAEGALIHSIRDLRGRRRIADVSRFLCALTPYGASDFREAATRIALARRGKGVMIVLSDFFFKEGYETGLRMLVGRGYDLYAIQILSPQELEPEGPGGIAGDLRLTDIEDGDTADVTISAPLLKRYKRNLAAYCDGLNTFCARREITQMTIRTDTPIDTLFLEYFRRRGLVG